MPLLINNAEVAQVLDMETCIAAMESGLREEGEGSGVNRTKSNIHIPTEDSETWYRYCTIEGGLRGAGVVALRIKSDMVSWPVRFGKRRENKYCVEPGQFCGLILLFSARNGELLAMMNDGVLQHQRVAAVAALAARFGARENARVVGILGSGGMAETHLVGMTRVRSVREVRVFSPDDEHRRDFAARMEQWLKLPVAAVDTPRDAVLGCDIVCACTDSAEPVLEGDWLEPGTWLTSVKHGEVEPAFPRVDRYVLYRSDICMQHFTTPPDWRPYGLGGSTAEWAKTEAPLAERTVALTDVLLGRAPARTNDREIVLFKSEGTGVEFAAAALATYEGAKAAGLGRELPLEWFLQDIRD